MPRGRKLFLSLHDKLMTSYDQREDACAWTAAALARASAETCDLELLFTQVRNESDNDTDLVENMRSCEGCLMLITRSAALRCGVCRIAYYCSHKCHKTHWSLHKKTCQKITKDERHAREAHRTAMRVVWSLYTAQIQSSYGVIPYAFSIDDNNCILNTKKPKSHSKYLTVMLMTRGDEVITENGKQKSISIKLLDPAKLLVFLKNTLRQTMAKQTVHMIEASQAEDNARNFRDTLIKLHTNVKQLHEKTHSGDYKHFIVITPMIDSVGFSFTPLSFRCRSGQTDILDVTFHSEFDYGEKKL